MMNQQPDKFFREKLEGHRKVVPASAWSKVGAKLDKKNSKPLWLKVAAAIILLITSSVIVIMNRDTDAITTISEKKQQDQQSPGDRSNQNPISTESAPATSQTPEPIKSEQPEKK